MPELPPGEMPLHRLRPRDDQRSIGATFRWSEMERIMLIAPVLGELSMQEVRAVAHGLDLHMLPNYRPRFTPIYDAIYNHINELAAADGGGGANADQAPYFHRRNVRVAVKTWALRLIRDGDLHDVPPHLPGYLISQNLPILTSIHELLVEGWRDSLGQKCLFRSLRDLERRKPDAYLALRAQLVRVETNEGVWSQLTTAFPQLTTMVLRTKKVRDAAAVKVSVSVQVQT